MRTDAHLYFSEAQAFTIDAYATNKLDLIASGALSGGRPMSVFIRVDVAASHADNDETYEFQVRTDGDEAFGSPTTLITEPILYSVLAADTLYEIPIPQQMEFERYMAVYFNGGGTTPTLTATIWLGESGSLPSLRKYPQGSNAA